MKLIAGLPFCIRQEGIDYDVAPDELASPVTSSATGAATDVAPRRFLRELDPDLLDALLAVGDPGRDRLEA